MRNYVSVLMIVLLFALASCASVQPNTSSSEGDLDNGYTLVDGENKLKLGMENRPNEERPSNLNLADMVGQLAGVDMAGRGNNVSFRVRGAASFFASSDPLFVLNGSAVGSDFSALANVVDPYMVKSIRVLKGSDASIYGARGANGVILIRTKKS